MTTRDSFRHSSPRPYRKKLGRQEQRIVEVADEYEPLVDSDWTAGVGAAEAPSDQSEALDLLAGAASGGAVKWVKAEYDFSVEGGAQGDIGLGVELPDNALVLYAAEEVLVDYDSAGSAGTIKLKLPTDGDLTNNQTADGSTPNADGIPNWSIANAVKSTAARQLTVEIGTEDLTAGKALFFIAYAISE